jgi:hypothetical protein
MIVLGKPSAAAGRYPRRHGADGCQQMPRLQRSTPSYRNRPTRQQGRRRRSTAQSRQEGIHRLVRRYPDLGVRGLAAVRVDDQRVEFQFDDLGQ